MSDEEIAKYSAILKTDRNETIAILTSVKVESKIKQIQFEQLPNNEMLIHIDTEYKFVV